MVETKQLTVPVIGMTCANCVASVERNSKKASGVADSSVNFASEKLTIAYEPGQVNPQEMLVEVIDRVERAGRVGSVQFHHSKLQLACHCKDTGDLL